jgi:putative endonuclease
MPLKDSFMPGPFSVDADGRLSPSHQSIAQDSWRSLRRATYPPLLHHHLGHNPHGARFRVHKILATPPHIHGMSDRSRRGLAADQRGRSAEDAATTALERDGWDILARRLRTSAGEIDIVAEKQGLLAIVEVKARPRLADAATSLSNRQQTRLISATDIILANNPQWGSNGVRFDLLLVDAAGVVRRIADAFRGNG